MKKLVTPILISVLVLTMISMTSDNTAKTLYDFKAKTLDGTEYDFSKLKGKKVMIVNTASECGYTPQYAGLQELYAKYDSLNFEIIGFPCNQFGGQEPGTATEIKTFCTKNYGVTFQMMEKVDVKGDHQCEIYKWLTHKTENGVEDSEVSWNFNKYLIDENGHYVKHLKSNVTPMDKEITDWIEGK
jgi:glutathione peroxidase